MNAHLCVCSRFPGGGAARQSQAQAERCSEEGFVLGFPAALAPEECDCAPWRACMQPHQDLPESKPFFLTNRNPLQLQFSRCASVQTASDKNPGVCFLQDEKDFRDKLSSIYVALNFSLDPNAAADSHGLRPILNYQTTNVIEQKVL